MRQHASALAEQEFSWYISQPPVTPIELETESLHGEPITDAYRWLEDLESPRVRTWIEAQTKRARGYLDSVPCRTRLAARIRAMNSADVVEFPLVKAGRYCYRKRVAGAEYPSIFYREKEDPHGEKLLVDGARLPEGPRSIHPVGLS